MAVKNKSNH